VRASFKMAVLEALVLPNVPDVILAGPVREGACQAGDMLVLRGADESRTVRCNGLELINWGSWRRDWISVRISDVDLVDVRGVNEAVALEGSETE